MCGSTDPGPALHVTAAYGDGVNDPFGAFDPGASPSPVHAGDWVRLAATATSQQQIVGYRWLVSAPAGDSIPESDTPDLVMQTKISGDYTAALTVTDLSGCTGATTIVVHVGAPLVHTLEVELTWGSCGDLDLHYTAPGASLCDAATLGYSNRTPDWGCANQNCVSQGDLGGEFPDGKANDPKMTADVNWGPGPESFTQTAPFDSSTTSPYQVWVYYYSNTPDSSVGSGTCGKQIPTVVISIDGHPNATYVLSNGITEGQAWMVANIVVTNSGKAITIRGGPSGTSSITPGGCLGLGSQ